MAEAMRHACPFGLSTPTQEAMGFGYCLGDLCLAWVTSPSDTVIRDGCKYPEPWKEPHGHCERLGNRG
jgi:hypothetical protein